MSFAIFICALNIAIFRSSLEHNANSDMWELILAWILFFSLRFILILQVTSTVASNASRQVKLNFDSHKVSYESLSKILSFYVTILDFIKKGSFDIKTPFMENHINLIHSCSTWSRLKILGYKKGKISVQIDMKSLAYIKENSNKN